MGSPAVSCRGFAVAAMLDARSISKTHPAGAVIIHVNAYHAAAVTYQSGSVVLVQHYPDAHALAQSFHAANVAIFHYLHALNAHAVNANAAVAVLETAAVIHATCVASQRPTPLLSPLVFSFLLQLADSFNQISRGTTFEQQQECKIRYSVC